MRKNIQKRNNHIFIARRKIIFCAEIIFFLRGEKFGSARRNFRGCETGGKIQLEKIWNAAAFGLKCS
jgi:hypothetical protein